MQRSKASYVCCEWQAVKGRPGASLVAQMVKNPPADAGDKGSVPGSERSPGGGHENPLQYSGLENPMDRGAWWATVPGLQRIGHDLATQHVN